MLDAPAGRELRDPRSDVYSLGRVLEFVLTGEPPRPGRSMRELETRIRRAAAGLTAREQNLLLEVLLPATADRREERTQTAAAFASDLRAVFDERGRGDLDARQYARAVFAELDALVAAQRLPLEELACFRASRELRALRRIFGSAANLVVRYFDVRGHAELVAVSRDVIAEMAAWPSRPFGSRQAFKKLAKELRESDDGSFPAALLPFLHLLWPDARLTTATTSFGLPSR